MCAIPIHPRGLELGTDACVVAVQGLCVPELVSAALGPGGELPCTEEPSLQLGQRCLPACLVKH